MNINKLFKFYSQYIWPIHKRIFRTGLRYRGFTQIRCKQCNLPEIADKNQWWSGICSLCTEFNKKPSEIEKIKIVGELIDCNPQEKDLQNLIDYQYKSYYRNKYDILLMLSGGKDSIYTLHRLIDKDKNLKVLCVYVDNGFASSYSLVNAKLVTNKLKVDLLVVNSYKEMFFRVFKDTFSKFKNSKSICSQTIDFVDGQLIFSIGLDLCRQFGIKALFSGISKNQCKSIVKIDSYFTSDQDVDVVYPMMIWNPSEQEILNYIDNYKLLPIKNLNPLLTNNDFIITTSALDILRNGYCGFEPEFSTMAREGKADRKTWLNTFTFLEYATKKGWLNKEINKTLGRLGLSLKDIVK